jgi:hypothetical protein
VALGLVVGSWIAIDPSPVSADPRDAEILALAQGMLDKIHAAPFPAKWKAYAVYGAETVRVPAFKKAYARILAQIPPARLRDDGAWLRLKSATTHPNHFVSTPLGDFVVVGACEPHNCPHQIVILFDPAANRIGALITGADTDAGNLELGEPSNEMAALVRLLVALDETDSDHAANRAEAATRLRDLRPHRPAIH